VKEQAFHKGAAKDKPADDGRPAPPRTQRPPLIIGLDDAHWTQPKALNASGLPRRPCGGTANHNVTEHEQSSGSAESEIPMLLRDREPVWITTLMSFADIPK
jgi:hypothetical protein